MPPAPDPTPDSVADPTPGRAPDVRAIERAAAAALMPLECARHDGWLLRANDGVTRRGNSVLADDPGSDPLAGKIDRAERFYRGRHLPPRFQLSPASQPPQLDAALAERGYVREEGALVMLAAAVRVADAGAAAGAATGPGGPHAAWQVNTAPEPSDSYLAVLTEVFPGAARQARSRATKLQARGAQPLHVTVTHDGTPTAAGLVVVDDALAGVFSVATRPQLRGRGAAAVAVRALAAATVEAGAHWLYLQVGTDNAAAIGLYRRTGFVERYRYHYRVSG